MITKQDNQMIGFDFGIKPNFMVVGDIKFSELFKQAECLGLAYVFEQINDNIRPVQIVFQFKNKEPADKVMATFMDWVSRSNDDGDAVDLTFIEKKDGSYGFSIGPELNRLIERIVPRDLLKKINPLVYVNTYFKHMTVQSDNYINFKENIKNTEEIVIRSVVGDPNLEGNWGKDFFKKKVFSFVKEGEIPQDSNVITYGMKDTKVDKKKMLPRYSKEQISERRISELRTLMPITFHKIQNLWLSSLVDELIGTYDEILIKQAICNLTVEERMKKDCTSDSSFLISEINRLQYLVSTYESFVSYYPDDDFYTIEKIKEQISNDQKVLEDYLKN
ncbi:hypothetical protein B9T12_04875 [Wohlfahrtiimonas chitiniclastica]|uniref:hypothetical protein n=1 Tax=Wohlfahrtiimonas TaxID=582472 RepID=UPI000B99388B|nr:MULTISPECIES: hypothetical protein [Wohlfahrtiimonas]OYQ75477.1 hypothetical protein B9T20_01900 [Wohlfahrtiimonas sp. G9077]OYQ79111.1 hypothetical protein B9T12_04875 [Wohlfahrtiimonas chitiniclastica]